MAFPIRNLLAAAACVGTLAAIALVQSAPPVPVIAEQKPAEPVLPVSQFVVEPYLQFGTRTSMIVMAETPVPTTCVVEYGPKFPPEFTAKNEKLEVVHEIKLDKLLPKTKYYYRMVCTDADGKIINGPASTFQTAVDPGDAYSFTVFGDTQRNPTVTGRVAKLMWERRPNFVVHLGDVVDSGPDKKQWTDDLFGPCRELFSRVAMFPCIGNHEKNHAYYYQYFSLPKPEYHYTFDYGNAQFFVLDTNKPVDAESEQYKWLERTLAASTAKWKICFHHHPLYSSDSDDYGNTAKVSSTYGALKHKPLIALYEKYNVDLAMNGHIHAYERTWPIRAGKVDTKAGITYLTSGGGGGNLEPFEPTPAFYKNQQRVVFHYCYFTAHNGVLDAKVLDQDDRLFDQFTLKKD